MKTLSCCLLLVVLVVVSAWPAQAEDNNPIILHTDLTKMFHCQTLHYQATYQPPYLRCLGTKDISLSAPPCRSPYSRYHLSINYWPKH